MAASTRASTLAHEAAVEATCLWLQGDHESCIQTLQRLELDHTLDDDCQLQVQHNLAIVDHYSNKRRDPSRLLDQLTLLLREATSKTSESPAPHVSPRGVHAPTTAITSQEAGAVAAAADNGAAVLRLNKALLLYQSLHYDEATQLLTPLLQHVDGLDEGIALHVLLLLLDMHLHQHHTQQAAYVLTILEKTCLASSFSAAAFQQQQCPTAAAPAVPPSSSNPNPSIHAPQTSQEASSSQPLVAAAAAGSHTLPFISNWGSAAMVEACHLLTQRGYPIPSPPSVALLLKLYRIRLALLQQNVRTAKRELRAMVALDCAPPASGSGLGPSAAAAGLGLTATGMPQLDTEASALLQAAEALGHSRAAAYSPSPSPSPEPASSGSEPTGSSGSEPSSGPSRAGAGPSSGADLLTLPCASSLLKAHVEVTRGFSKKAAHILSSMESGGGAPAATGSASSSNGDGGPAALRPALLNNLGVVLHSSGKHQLSALHFKQAMRELDPGGAGAAAGGKGAEPSGRESEASYQEFAMLYNAGLQYAALGRHSPALSCLSRCVSASQHASGLAAHRPLLLLRAAQASLSLYQQRRSAGAHRSTEPWGPSAPPPASASSSDPPSSALDSLPAPAGEQPMALLHQALRWLQMACELLEPQRQQQQRQQQQEPRPAASSGGTSFPPLAHASHEDTLDTGVPSDNHSAVEQHHRCVLPAILTHLAYVHLLLGERDAALAASMQLLSMPNVAPNQVQEAACYAAEVLKALGRDSEAVDVMLQAQAAWAAALVTAGAGPGSLPPEADRMESHGEAAPGTQAGEGTAGAEAAMAAATPTGDNRTEADRASRAALCTNLAAMLVSQPTMAETAGPSVGSEGMATGPRPLVSEALELQPGCQPALIAAYLDMISGRCNDALVRIREMQL